MTPPRLLPLLLVGCAWLQHPAASRYRIDGAVYRLQLPAIILFETDVDYEYRQIVQRAAQYWNETLQQDIFELAPYSESMGSIVFVRLKDKMKTDPDHPDNEELADTALGTPIDGLLPFANVTFYQEWIFHESASDMESTARHELAHAMGLDHIKDANCLMFWVIIHADQPRPACSEELQMLRSIYPYPASR